VVVVAGAMMITGVVVGAAPYMWRSLNAHEETPVQLPLFSGLAQRSQIFDVANRQLGVFELENSQPVLYDNVPPEVVSAFLAVEDAGFFRHKGVNLRALGRASFANFALESGRQGASTITQQVVKNEYLSGLPRDGRYKILQSRYATMLEKQAPKEKILERYLNTVYFGNNAYGLQAAAEVYFGTPVSELSMVQGAFLAGLVRAPSTYDPIRRPEQSRRRFKQALDRLVDVELMTKQEAQDTFDTWQIPERLTSVPQQSTTRTYFTEMVRDYLLNRSAILGATYQERYNALFRGGLKVYTTLDARAQQLAEEAVQEQLPANRTGIAASLVALDTETAAVRVVVGGPGFVPGRDEVNLALRRRQTGSASKVFILTAALEAGVEGKDIIEGTLPCTMPNPGQPREPFEIKRGVSKPLTTVEEHTWLSINCAYARLSQIVGLQRVVNTVYRLASSPYLTRDYPVYPYPSFATGANELSAFDMASAGQTIANGGVHHDPYFIERIEGPNGTIYTHMQQEGEQVISADVANRQVDIMKGVMTRGTARRSALNDDRPSAGKTGTQDENTNAWFMGFTKQISAAVWVGDPKGYTPMNGIPEFAAVGVPRVQGSTFPARIWKAFMDPAHNRMPILDWEAPLPSGRNPVRLFLPGVDCIAEVVSGRLPRNQVGPVATVIPTVPTTTTTVAPPIDGDPSVAPPTAPQGNRPVVSVVDSGTTIPPDVTDPTVLVAGVDPDRFLVYECAKGIPRTITTVTSSVQP
jgi:membrane peptidoglycan carboxypeptidase